jgi:hypothetical protein
VDRCERRRAHATPTTSSALGSLPLADWPVTERGGRIARAGRVIVETESRHMMGRVMNDSALERSATEMLTYEVSDDALEAAAGGSEMPGRTFYGCLPPMPLTMAYGCPSAE